MSSPTEKQLALAAELGIEGAAAMSSREISDALEAAPATGAQVHFVKSLMAYLEWPDPPVGLTFGQASRMLDDVAPLVNERVVMENDWSERDILCWNGGYYRIVTIHTHRMFTLERVELSRPRPDGPAVASKTSDRQTLRHPLTLAEDDAVKIDLNTVQP